MLVELGDNLRATEGDACALEEYTEGTRRCPTYCQNNLRMAMLFAENGRLDEVEQIVLRGTETVAVTHSLWELLGILQERNGRSSCYPVHLRFELRGRNLPRTEEEH